MKASTTDGREPGQPGRAARPANGPIAIGLVDEMPLEAVRQQARRRRADEDDLQQAVDRRADQDRVDDRPRQVALGVLDLAGQLVSLLEAQVGEDDARARDRGQHGLRATGIEAAGRLKLPGWNLKNSTMMAATGTATFHQVIALLTRLTGASRGS